MESDQIKVLLIEDNPGDARLIQEMLRSLKHAQIQHKTCLKDGLQYLLTESVDVVLLDLGLPDSQNLDTFYIVKKNSPFTPVVVLTGNRDEEVGEKAVQEGAQDFYIKGEIDEYSLRRAIKYAMERFEIHEQLNHLNHVLMSIRNVNQLIVQERDPKQLVQKICNVLVDNRGYNAAWIALADTDGKPYLAAHCGWNDHFDSVEDILSEGIWTACHETIEKSGDDIIVINPQNQCDGCPLREFYGGDLSIVIELRHGDRCYGMLVAAFHSKINMDDFEKSLIREVAGDIAFALHSIDLEEREKEIEKQYQRLYKTMAQGVVFQNSEGQIIHANPAAEKILGLTLDQMQGRTSIDTRWRAIREDGSDLPGDEHFAMIALRTGQSASGIMGVVNSQTAQYTWINVHAVPEYDDSMTKPIGVFSTFEDITERKIVQQQLAESVEKYRAMVQNIGIGVTMISPDMRILEMNRQMREWYPGVDISRNPLCFRHFRNPAKDEVCDECPTVMALRTGKAAETIIDVDFGGKTRRFRVAASPIRDESGDVVAAIEMVEDITERLSLEEQLRQSQKLEAIGQLAGGVAHDFNNMLGVIIGYGELMMDTMHENDPLHELANEIVKAGQRSAGLTRQLLAFSRKQTLQLRIVDLNMLIENLNKMLRRLIGEDIDYETYLTPDLDLVEVDPGQIEQVIINMAVNARDAMPHGGKLTIETRNFEVNEEYVCTHYNVDEGRYVSILISDNGIGMDEETRRKIFEPFFTTKGKGKGTGLGLATVYGIVRQLGGTIMVYSEEDKGTTFKVLLPISKSGTEEPQQAPLSEKTISLCEKKILIVEDDDSLRFLIQRAFKKLNCEVRTSANGGEALLEVEEKGFVPDIIVTDVVMPEMSGKILINRLRKTMPNLKFVFMSGYTDNAIVHHGILDPDTPFIQKPFNMKDLIKKIEDTLNS